MSVIQVSGLVKNFGNFQALAGLNMSVEEGTVHGFLGPNGAGKTSFIRIINQITSSDYYIQPPVKFEC